MTLEEENKIIAEFMGAKLSGKHFGDLYLFENPPTKFLTKEWNIYAISYLLGLVNAGG